MAAGNVTVTTADKFIDEVWSDELNTAVQFSLVIAALFSDWTKRMQGHGDIFHLVAEHNLTANTKSASTAATAEVITETEQTFTVNTHQIVAQEIEDIAEILSRYEIRARFNKKASYSLGRAMDVAAAALLDDNTTQTVGTLGSENSDDHLLLAWTYLQNASADGDYKAVMSPAVYAGFLKIDKFINSLYNGDDAGMAVHKAQVGKAPVYNITFHASPLTVGTSPNSDGHIWAEDHFFKIIKRTPTPHAWYSPLDVAWVVTMDQIYGVFERQEADEAAAVTTTARLWGVRMRGVK